MSHGHSQGHLANLLMICFHDNSHYIYIYCYTVIYLTLLIFSCISETAQLNNSELHVFIVGVSLNRILFKISTNLFRKNVNLSSDMREMSSIAFLTKTRPRLPSDWLSLVGFALFCLWLAYPYSFTQSQSLISTRCRPNQRRPPTRGRSGRVLMVLPGSRAKRVLPPGYRRRPDFAAYLTCSECCIKEIKQRLTAW